MAITISKIFNANIYIDGTTELLGRAKECKLPDITTKMVEHTALGLAGTLELPAGLDKMSITVKWQGFYADLVKCGVNPFTSHKLQIRANHETFTTGGRTEQKSLVIHVTGSWKKFSMGNLKAQDASESDDELSVTYIKCILDGEELFEIDVFANVWKVAGVDILEAFRTNLSG
jgi:uncharacterized protein